MTDAAMSEVDDAADSAAEMPGGAPPPGQRSIVPRDTISGRALVAVIAIIQGMNAYVKENIADAMVGSNAFQVRRTPLDFALIEDDQWRRIQRRPKLTRADAGVVAAALPDAQAVAMTSGWPTPQSDVVWGDRTLGDVLVFGITPPYQVVQDYRFARGEPLNEVDVRDRRAVVIVGHDVGRREQGLLPAVRGNPYYGHAGLGGDIQVTQ